MKAVWKHVIHNGQTSLNLPDGAIILSVGSQEGRLVAWALVDPEQPVLPHPIRVLMTGESFSEDPGRFVGTVQLGDWLIAHVFDLG